MSNSQSSSYRPDIDGLRAIAILSVIVFHAFPHRIKGGFVGVDIFFVISGYLITHILVQHQADRRFLFGEFYLRRVRRIFPALLTMLLGVLGAGLFLLFSYEYAQLGKHTLAGALFASNFVLWSESGYFDSASDLKLLLHLWSLAVEEQFYILWPLLIWMAYKLKIHALTVASTVALASFGLNLYWVHQDATATFYFPFTRFWELLAGACLTCLERRPSAGSAAVERSLRRGWIDVANVFATLGLVLMLSAIFGLNKNKSFPGWWALLPVLGTMLLIHAGAGAFINRRLLGHRFMVGVGLISYPLYLWHWPLLAFVRILHLERPSSRVLLAALGLSLILAWLTYRLIELPIRSRRHDRRIPIYLLLMLMGVGIYGAIAYYSAGFASLHDPQQVKNAKAFAWDDSMLAQAACVSKYAQLNPHFCLIDDPNQAPTVALLGDSHANHYFPGLSHYYHAKGDNLLMLGESACAPWMDVESHKPGDKDKCRRFMNAIFDFAIRDSNIHTVIVSGRGPLYVNGHGYGRTDTKDIQIRYTPKPQMTDDAAIFTAAMAATLNRLLAAHKQVIFIIDDPELGFDPKSCLDLRPYNPFHPGIKSPCAIDRRSYDQRSARYRKVVREVLEQLPQVQVFDPTKYLCDDQHCWAIRAGEILYRDDDHFSYLGSSYLGRRFAEERDAAARRQPEQ